MEGRKCAVAGGDQAFLMVVSLSEIVIHLLEKYFMLYLKLEKYFMLYLKLEKYFMLYLKLE